MSERPEKTELGIEQVYERLQELEKRVAELEREAADLTSLRVQQAGLLGSTADGRSKDRPLYEQSADIEANSTEDVRVKPAPHEEKSEEEKGAGSTNVVAVVGKAILAMAGAYLLRAIAESETAPRWILLVAGMAYAGGWLVWAARTHRRSHFASVIFGLTVAFILAPLLWEGTVRFQVLSAGFTARVLAGYVVLSLALGWKEKLQAIPWIAVVAAVGTSAALLVATHELRALTLGLLGMAMVTEVEAWSGRCSGLRMATALGADFAVTVMGFVMTAPGGAPAEYRPMSVGEVNAFCLALLAIYGVSMAVRGFVLGSRWTILEVAQAAVAFGLGTWLSLRATAGGSAEFLGATFLVLAAGCYWGALRRFAEAGAEAREKGTGLKTRHYTKSNQDARWNRRVSANFAAGLVLAGSYLLLGGDLQVVLLSAAAVAAVLVFTRTGHLSLGIHGTFYLLAAGMVCGLFGYAGRALAGSVPAWPEWSFWVVAVAGLASYLAGSRAPGEGWRARVLWVVPAAVVGFAVAAVVVAGIAGLGLGMSASRVSMVRTVVTCVIALGMGYAGSRWNRVELGWVAYGAIGLGALKLVLEDLRFGNAATLMVSLLFYGLILVLLPKVTRFGRVEV
jgi:hypothetical protein